MSQQQDDLWRDVSIVLKHSRLIIALLLISLAAAIASGLLTQTEYKAVSQATLEIRVGTPLSGRGDAVPTLETYAELAASDDVFAAAADTLDMDAKTVSRNITVTATDRDPRVRTSLNRLTITATGDSRGQAKAIASAVMDAFEEAAARIAVDPRGLTALERQAELAGERTRAADQSGIIELAQVQSDLTRTRAFLSNISGDAAAIARARELVAAQRSRPLGELLVAVSGVLAGSTGGVGLDRASTVAELENGLRLRLDLTETLISQSTEDVRELATREKELLIATADESSAAVLYATAVQNVQAAKLAGTLTDTTVEVVSNGVDASSDVNWPARLAAAAAFGLAVGVVGAFVLEFLVPHWQRWRQGRSQSRPEES